MIVTSHRFTCRSDLRADCVHTLLSEVCTAPHREEEEKKKKKTWAGVEMRTGGETV